MGSGENSDVDENNNADEKWRCEHENSVHEDPYIRQNMKGARIADDGETMMIGVCACVYGEI